MKRQLMVLLFALPVCLIAGAWPSVKSGHQAAPVALKSHAGAMLLSLYHSLPQLPEAVSLLILGACCFVLAWLLHRRWVKAQS